MQELGIGVNMTLMKQNAFQLSEASSTNSLIKGEKAKEASFWRSSSCRQLYGLSLRTTLPSTSGPYVSALIFNPNWLFQAYLKQ